MPPNYLDAKGIMGFYKCILAVAFLIMFATITFACSIVTDEKQVINQISSNNLSFDKELDNKSNPKKVTIGAQFSIFGLILDILGAWFLARGLVRKTNKEIRLESGTYYGGNRFLSDSLNLQRIESRVGFGFLFLGFSFQLIGNLSDYLTYH
jgi:hypothetical protein